MNRIDICKNIIQSIKEYITNSDKLEPHRAQNYFIFMLLIVLNSNFQIQNPILNFLVKCSDTLILPDDLPWGLLLLYMMYLMITLFMPEAL